MNQIKTQIPLSGTSKDKLMVKSKEANWARVLRGIYTIVRT